MALTSLFVYERKLIKKLVSPTEYQASTKPSLKRDIALLTIGLTVPILGAAALGARIAGIGILKALHSPQDKFKRESSKLNIPQLD